MNNKRFLACLLVACVVFSQNVCFGSGVCAESTQRGFNKNSDKTKLGIGVGSSLLLTATGMAFIFGKFLKNHEKRLMNTMHDLIDYKNNGVADAGIYAWCHQKGLYPESVFNCVEGYVPGVLPQKRYVAICYYGKNAFKNCLEDETESKRIGVAAYARSTHTIWYDDQNKKYIFGAPGDKLPDGYYLRRFVEFGDRIYAASPSPTSPSDVLIIDKLTVNSSGNVISQTLGFVIVDAEGNVIVNWWFFPGKKFFFKSKTYDEVVSKISTWPH